MKKLISNKEVLKDAFQAITYYVFIATFLKLALPATVSEPLTHKFFAYFVFLLLYVLATCYSMFHVSSGVTKLYFPCFKTPIIDDEFQPIKWRDLFGGDNFAFKRKGLILWLSLGLPYYFVGAEIVRYALKSWR